MDPEARRKAQAAREQQRAREMEAEMRANTAQACEGDDCGDEAESDLCFLAADVSRTSNEAAICAVRDRAKHAVTDLAG